MGVTYTTVEIINLSKKGNPYSSEFLVDTRAIDCMAPADALERSGIEVEGHAAYELADGTLVKYPFGFARVTFMGAETVSQVIFGPEGCEPILGVVALENTGIGVDPVTRTLKRMDAKPLK